MQLKMLSKNKIILCKFIIMLIFFIGILIGIIVIECVGYDKIRWLGVALGLILAPSFQKATHLFQDMLDITTWQKCLRKLKRGKILKKDDYIRISFAYLFRIKIDGKFLLVKNARGTCKFQPVGGCYKCFDNEKKLLTGTKFNVLDDYNIPMDESSRNDYRMKVPVKNFKKFVKRFDKTKDRETIDNLSREFNEELIVKKILDKEIFNEIFYQYCGRNYYGIYYSKHFECYELLLADVVELIPTKEQEQELRKSLKTKNEMFGWFSEETIKTCGVKKGTEELQEKISDHSWKIVSNQELEECTYKLGKEYSAKLNN